MFGISQRRVLSCYRAGRYDEAFALQRELQGGRLRLHQAMALNALGEGSPSGGPRLFACGEYEPRRAGPEAGSGGPQVGGLGCSFSEAVLRLKGLRRPRASAQAGRDAEALTGYFAVRLARGLRLLMGQGVSTPVTVATVPAAEAGPPAFGLDQVVRRGCALAGAEYSYGILLLRGASLPRAHLSAGPRRIGPQILSLMPVRSREIRGRSVVLVDDVVSSGSTLKAAVTLMSLYNEARAVGLALAKTKARGKDAGAVKVL